MRILARRRSASDKKIQGSTKPLHDEECERVFFDALAGYRYGLGQSGELTICRGLRPI
jgi:hypothetical protein